MLSLKNYGMLVFRFLVFLLLGSFFISLLYYFLFSSKAINVLAVIYLGFLFFIFSYQSGKKIEKKGFFEGLKIGFLFLFVLFLVNLLFYRTSFSFLRVLYYLIYLLISIFGATFGINKKKE